MATAVTRVATWGNSEAIRLPRALLVATGLKPGDRVSLTTTTEGNIEVRRLPQDNAHRRVVPSRRVTFEDLFAEYHGGRLDNRDAWPQQDLTPAEREAWS